MHSCCGPCTTFPLYLLRSLGHEVDGTFYNPNIYPWAEREKRLSVYENFAKAEGMSLRGVCTDEGAYAQSLDAPHRQWRDSVSKDLEKPGRCRLCYFHRLLPVARLARAEGYDSFTTSLLLSIYQDHEGIAASAEEASRLAGVPFLYMDFSVGYRRSREMARGRHLYMQKYCGCEYSMPEQAREVPQ